MAGRKVPLLSAATGARRKFLFSSLSAATSPDFFTMPDGKLSALLSASSLGHLEALLGAETLDGLEGKLDSAGRTGLLNHFKALGLTALKDRQGLANAIAKAKRERENGPSTPSPAAGSVPMDMQAPTGPLLE